MSTQQLESQTEDFAQRMLNILNDGALAIMISIGHRTGLFDTMANLSAARSEQIADAARLNERYVREWLGAMTTGRILDYDSESRTFSMPPGRAALLTRKARADNLAFFAQYIGLMATVEDGIVNCFREGGGLPYSAYPRFHEVMAEESSLTVVGALLTDILPLVPGLVERLQTGIKVLDVGCGSGRAINTMAAAFPNSRFTGYDFSKEAIEHASAEAEPMQTNNAQFEVRDVAAFDRPMQYQLITAFDAIHDQAHPRRVLRNIADALTPDGVFLMQDIRASSFLERNLDHPLAPLLYTASCMHCMTVSLADDGEGLGTMWGEEKARELLAEAGFRDVEIHQLPHDIQNSYYVARK